MTLDDDGSTTMATTSRICTISAFSRSLLENRGFAEGREGKQIPAKGLNTHHTDNARYFPIITPFPPGAYVVTPRDLYRRPMGENRW